MMIVKIKRQASPEASPYWQSFNYDGAGRVTVSAVLDALNYTDDLFDINGNSAPRIRWDCSCMQSVCGGCAMVINGKPRLACATYIDELKEKQLTLEPLSKFPVIADLVVDRSVIYENLNKAKAYLESNAKSNKTHHEQQYSVAKCLKCGLCLEVCPNYGGGEFFGAILANESYLLTSQVEDKDLPIIKEYKKHFSKGCSKALSCQSVCPMKIKTLTSILRMNKK